MSESRESFPEDVGLTSEQKYGKTYDSRVTADKLGCTSVQKHLQALEDLELPTVVHMGPCYVGLRFGVVTELCPCLSQMLDGDRRG